VGPPRDAAGVGYRGSERGCAIQKLHYEPEAQDDDGGDFNDKEKEQRDEREHACEWVGNKIGAQDAGNRPARSNAGDPYVIVQYGVDDTGAEPAQQIEYEIVEVAQPVFDVVTEDPQIPHVPNEVQPAGVQKHRSEEGQGNRADRQVRLGPGEDSRRYNAVLHDESIQMPAL